MFPDCRNDDFYNVDFLNNDDKEFIKGMDYALEAVKNLIDNNLETYEAELNEVLEDGYEPEEDEIFSKRQDLYEVLEENKEIISNIIEHWHESERDMMITSMIDNMDDDEYKKNREEAINKHITDKYYDSRKFACTGKKVFHKE